MREIKRDRIIPFTEKEQERIKKACTFLAGNDLSSFPDGRLDIIGDEIFAVFQSYRTSPAKELSFEAHRKYIDLQYILSGTEKMLVADLAALTHEIVPYGEEDDIVFYEDPPSFSEIILTDGDYTFFATKDGHKTRCSAGQPGREIKKVIVKILAEAML